MFQKEREREAGIWREAGTSQDWTIFLDWWWEKVDIWTEMLLLYPYVWLSSTFSFYTDFLNRPAVLNNCTVLIHTSKLREKRFFVEILAVYRMGISNIFSLDKYRNSYINRYAPGRF